MNVKVMVKIGLSLLFLIVGINHVHLLHVVFLQIHSRPDYLHQHVWFLWDTVILVHTGSFWKLSYCIPIHIANGRIHISHSLQFMSIWPPFPIDLTPSSTPNKNQANRKCKYTHADSHRQNKTHNRVCECCKFRAKCT